MPQDKRRWATRSEISWLMSSIPDYSEAQKKRRYDKYWPTLFEKYFEDFPPPEPTADDSSDTADEDGSDSEPPLDSAEEELFATSAAGKRKQKLTTYRSVKRAKKIATQQALSREDRVQGHFIRKRQRQLKSFMQWHCPPIPRASRKKGGSAPGMFGLPVFGKPAAHPKRLSQEDEIYISLFYPTRIIHKVRERIEQDNFKGPAVNLIRKIAREMYEEEDEETRSIVTAAVNAQRVGKAEEDEEGDEENDKPTPEQYQQAIDAFPPYIDALLQEVTKHTGFCATLIMGGPIPAHNGAISTVSYHMGSNSFGSTFGTANRSYSSNIIGPYTEFLRTIYSSETRAARALNAPPLGSALPALSTEGLHTLGPLRTTPAPSITAPRKLSSSAPLPSRVLSPNTSFAPAAAPRGAIDHEQALRTIPVQADIPPPLMVDPASRRGAAPLIFPPATSNIAITHPVSSAAHPSPRHNRIALNFPPTSTDREAASAPAAPLGYKATLNARAEAEALAATAVNAEEPAANTGSRSQPKPRPKPRPTKKKKSVLVESEVTEPITVSNPSVHQLSPPVIASSGAGVGLQGRPRRGPHMTAAAELLADEKKAKAAASAASAAKRAERAIANETAAGKETQPKKRMPAAAKSKISKK